MFYGTTLPSTLVALRYGAWCSVYIIVTFYRVPLAVQRFLRGRI